MSHLFDEAFEKCTMIDRRSVPDSMGGYTKEWVNGATFEAAINKDNTLAARVAEKQGVTEVYTVTTYKGVTLEFHDVFRRASDGLTYRVTSNSKDSETPPRATFQLAQVNAERWDLPND